MTKLSANNITKKDDAFKKMVTTLDELVAILKAHCGPFSDYAVIIDPINVNAEPIFTKDGINIVRGIKYSDQIKEFTRSSLQYIGSRVETSAGDGTTSAMIICATMLKVLLEEVKKSEHVCSTTEFSMLFDKINTLIKNYYDEKYVGVKEIAESQQLDAKTLKRVIKNIAYWQAYTSSHGDLELATAVSELFANTPIDSWNGLTLESSRYETKFRYKTEVDTAQYTLEQCRPFPVTQVRSELGLACNRDNTRVIISNLAPCLAIVDTADLIKKIDAAIESGEELTVICPDEFRDAPTIYHFDELFKKYPNHNVIFFFVSCMDRLNDIVGARILGIPGLNENGEHTISYRFKNSSLKIIKGLYPETDADIYPYTDVTEYKELLDKVNDTLLGLTNSQASQNTNRALKHVQKFLFKLTAIKRPSLVLGGASYDNITAVDVAVDAISATKKSLTSGFVLGGNKTLYAACLNLISDALKNQPDHYRWFIAAIFKAIITSIEVVYDCVNAPITKGKKKSIEFDYSENVLDRQQEKQKFENTIIYSDKLIPIIIQPKSMDLELISRFGEVALKFLKIDKIVSRV